MKEIIEQRVYALNFYEYSCIKLDNKYTYLKYTYVYRLTDLNI